MTKSKKEYDISPAQNISQLKLMMFYAFHPSLTISKIDDIAMHSGMLRNIFFMDADYLNDPLRCSVWSKIRENTDMNTVYLNILIIAVFLVCVWRRLSAHGTHVLLKLSLCAAAVLMLGYAFIVPYISNGEADLAKHMFLYAELIDAAVVAILLLALGSDRRAKILASALLFIFAFSGLRPAKTPETMSIGGIEWLVIDEGNTCKTLFAKEPVEFAQYNSSNDNNYRTSDIHRWLNGRFLNNFSAEEQAQLCTRDEEMLLSVGYKSEATLGNRDYYCAPYPENTVSDYDSAYREIISAKVFLPTTKHISTMADKHFKTATDTKYWLSTPYFNNSEMSRYVHTDGLVYFDYTTESMGIRPIIYVKNN